MTPTFFQSISARERHRFAVVHITYLGHAQLFINVAGKTLLVDPWFAEPVYEGTWFRYPPPPYRDASTMPHPNFLLLTQSGPDHSGPGTLAKLAKDLRTFAVPFPSQTLKRRLESMQFTRTTWLDGWQTHELAPGLKVTFIPHDEGQEIASIVIEGDGLRAYHGSDNALSSSTYRRIVERLGRIDIAFLPFAQVAVPPLDLSGDKETVQQRCAERKAAGLRCFLDGIEGLQPAEAVPFASSWALLDPKEQWKNYADRPTPDEVLAAAMAVAIKHNSHLLRAEPGDEWTPETGLMNKQLTAGWGYDAQSIARYAEQQHERVALAQTSATSP